MSTGYLIKDQQQLYFLIFQIVKWGDIFQELRIEILLLPALIFVEKIKD